MKINTFRNQTLTPEQQIAFSTLWGEVEPHPLGSRADTHPEGIPKEVMVMPLVVMVLVMKGEVKPTGKHTSRKIFQSMIMG